MSQSRTLYLGLDVHKEASAVAYVAHDQGAEVTDLGPMGTRRLHQPLEMKSARSRTPASSA
jgi:hypothetical protein